jgi:hypothetical protein
MYGHRFTMAYFMCCLNEKLIKSVKEDIVSKILKNILKWLGYSFEQVLAKVAKRS